jgi:hypothetical protein
MPRVCVLLISAKHLFFAATLPPEPHCRYFGPMIYRRILISLLAVTLAVYVAAGVGWMLRLY